jgi:guanylate kinase
VSKSRTSTKKRAKAKPAKRAALPRHAAAKKKATKRPVVASGSTPVPRLVPERPSSILLIVSGPSGAGKSTMARRLSSMDNRIWRSVSMTTRPPRAGEMTGIDYLFVSRDEFQRAIADRSLLEYAQVHGEFYGTPRGPVVDRLTQGRDVLLEIDVQGATQVKRVAGEAVLVFVAPPSRAVLERRLRDRNSETEERVQARLAAADSELERAREYDYYVVNDDLEKATADLLSIVTAERSRIQRRPGISW